MTIDVLLYNMTFEEFRNIKTGRSTLESYIKTNYIELYNDIIQIKVNVDFKTKSYMYFKNLNSIPVCKICGKPTKFHGYEKGFGTYCCSNCRAKDEEVEEKRINTLKDKFGDEYSKVILKKSKQTCLERYGNENYNNIEKAKQTCLERYGTDNYAKTQEYKEKSKQTCLERYGSIYWFNSNECLNRKDEYINKSKQTYLEKYGFSQATMNETIKQKISNTIQKKYGVQWACMRPEIYKNKRKDSHANISFAQLLKDYNIEYTKEYAINKYSYDFKIGNTLVEINPSATHNITWSPYPKNRIDSKYHKEKSQLAKENGFRCIHVWDWDDKDKIISLLQPKKSIMARKCIVREVSKKECNIFLNQYHLQGTCKNQTIRLGLYYNNKLVELMTFGKPRYNKKYEYELLRLCTCSNNIVAGGSERLFKYFINNYNPQSIVSYCDNSKFSGEVYERLGFKLYKYPQPSIHWYNVKTNTHITNNMLLQRGFDQLFGTNYGKGISNKDLMLEYNFVEIYDAGQSTYIWNNKNTVNIYE